MALKLHVNKFIRTFVNRAKRSEAFMNVLKSRREFMSLGKFGRSARGIWSYIKRHIPRARLFSSRAILRESLQNRILDAPVRPSRKIGFSDLSDAHARKNSTESMIARNAGRRRTCDFNIYFIPHTRARDNVAPQMGQ